jgi:hypothetical protein
MDLVKTLSELYAERLRVARIIATLEELHGLPAGRSPKKRGRKNMDAEAREVVSQRMKRYWAARKEQAPKDSGPAAESTTDVNETREL